MSNFADDKKTLLETAPPAYNTTAVAIQPAFRVAMSTSSRNSADVEIGNDGQREFTHGLLDCCETPGSCLKATFLPCFSYGLNKKTLDNLNRTGLASDHSGCGLSCGLYFFLPQILPVGQVLLQATTRYQIRQRFNIRGDWIKDTLASLFCAPCALVQESRELQLENSYLSQEERMEREVVREVEYRDIV